MNGIPVGIAGIGKGLPDWVLPNEYFEQFFETSDEWIRQRVGIKERRWIREGERPSDLFVNAGREAIEMAGISVDDIDLIVVASVSGDYTVPSMACVVQDRLGIKGCPAFDIAAGCTGFVYGLSTGAQFVATGTYKNVLVIGGEALSRISDIYDRNSVIIFADGAGAAVLQPHEVCQQGLIEDVSMGADGSGYHFIIRPKGGGIEPVTPEILAEGTHLLRMKGREVYRFAVTQMLGLMKWAMEGQDPEDLGLVVPHQMNRRILETCVEKLGISAEKLFINIDKLGNTSAGTIPIALTEANEQGLLEKGKLIVMPAFGAGLTWGCARVRW